MKNICKVSEKAGKIRRKFIANKKLIRTGYGVCFFGIFRLPLPKILAIMYMTIRPKETPHKAVRCSLCGVSRIILSDFVFWNMENLRAFLMNVCSKKKPCKTQRGVL